MPLPGTRDIETLRPATWPPPSQPSPRPILATAYSATIAGSKNVDLLKILNCERNANKALGWIRLYNQFSLLFRGSEREPWIILIRHNEVTDYKAISNLNLQEGGESEGPFLVNLEVRWEIEDWLHIFSLRSYDMLIFSIILGNLRLNPVTIFWRVLIDCKKDVAKVLWLFIIVEGDARWFFMKFLHIFLFES